MVNVTIIIVSYNTKEMTLECIHSVYEQTSGISFEVIVFDNDSSDGSAEAIEELFPQIRLIKSPDNLGFAKANNEASQLASGQYLLLLNPDTIILDGAIQKLYAFALRRPEHRIYGGRTLFADHSLNPTSCWRQQNLWGLTCYSLGLSSIFKGSTLLNPGGYGSWLRDREREVGLVSGCFLLIDRVLWDKLRGFYPDFFMYGEDADLCLRGMANGARPVMTPDAEIIHYGGASEKVRADKVVRLLRAKEDLLKHHWGEVSKKIGVSLLSMGVFNRMFAFRLLKWVFPKRFKVAADNWREVWARRKEWHNA